MKRFIRYIALMALLAGCQGRENYETANLTTVYFIFDPVAGKSLTVNESHISNCNIMVYDSNGNLVTGSYNASGIVPSVSFAARQNLTYRFYCVCNIGDITSVSQFGHESGLANYQYSVQDYSDMIDGNGAVPMTGRSSYLSVNDGMNVNIDLTRCVALVTLRIDDSNLDNATLTINSLRLKNVPKKVGLFATSAAGSSADCVPTGDSASSMEIAAFNVGESVGFYMFENCQGVLLPGNTTCSGKVFSQGSIYERICSYIEMDGYYDDQNRANARYGNFTYRFYLGGDSTTDFSLVRNHRYEITIELNDDGVDEVSWRVDEDLTPYVTSILVNPSEYTFWGITGTCQLTATVLPSTAASAVTWSSGNPAVATVTPTGTVVPHSYGNAVIKATATDGSGVYGTCNVSVRNGAAYPVSITPNYLAGDEWLLKIGSSVSDFAVTIEYSDGSSRTLTGAEALATVDTENSDFTVSGGVLSAANYTRNYQQAWAELYLEYIENGHYVSFTSDGGIFAPDELFTASFYSNVIGGYGARTVVVDVPQSLQGIQIAASDVVLSTNSPILEATNRGFKLKANDTTNGPVSYSVTGVFTDSFDNYAVKTVSGTSTIYEWRERFYRVEINTKVRTHIDTSPGSQEPADNIIVRCYLECTGQSDILVNEYYYPASYDEEGNLSEGYFTYTWYDTTVSLQMQDDRDYYFNYDRNGNYLQEGYCIENGRYYYFLPF